MFQSAVMGLHHFSYVNNCVEVSACCDYGLLPLDLHNAHHVFGLKKKIDLTTCHAAFPVSPLDIGRGGLDQRRGQPQPSDKLVIMIQHEITYLRFS